jgi:hypothetical protein
MNLQDLAELEQKATPGPWKTDSGCVPDEPIWRACGPVHGCEREDNHDCICGDPGGPLEKAAAIDAQLLTSLRNLAPELIQLLIVVKDTSDTCLGRNLIPMDAALAALEEKLKAMDPLS